MLYSREQQQYQQSWPNEQMRDVFFGLIAYYYPGFSCIFYRAYFWSFISRGSSKMGNMKVTLEEVSSEPLSFGWCERNTCDRQLGEHMGKFAQQPCCFHRRHTAKYYKKVNFKSLNFFKLTSSSVLEAFSGSTSSNLSRRLSYKRRCLS